MPTVYLTRRCTFSASHRLHSETLSAEENKELFGKCNHSNGHGHNYEVEVTLRGNVDAQTGLVMNLASLKQAMEKTFIRSMDHKHLNMDVPEFKKLNPSVENVAVVIWKMLSPALPAGLLHEVKVYETENNSAVYRGD